MPNRAESSATFFYLRGSQDPFNPVLTSRVLNNLSKGIHTSPFKGERARSNDLLIERTKPTGLGIIMESFGPFMGPHQSDLEMIIYRLTTSSLPLDKLFVIIPFLELRDDKVKGDAGPLARLFADKIAHADKDKKIASVAVWEPHSSQGIETLRSSFEEHGNPIPITPLTEARLFARRFLEMKESNPKKRYVLIAPDFGSLHRIMLAAQVLQVPVVFFEKIRPKIEKTVFKDAYIANDDNGLARRATKKDLAHAVGLTIDDVGGTARTQTGISRALRNRFDVSEVHAAISQAALIQPEARKRLFAAMESRNITSVTFTDSLPLTIDGDIEVASIAEPTAALIHVTAGQETDKDRELLEKVLYPAGPTKDEVRQLLREGILSLDPNLWPPQTETLQRFPQNNVIYKYTPIKTTLPQPVVS